MKKVLCLICCLVALVFTSDTYAAKKNTKKPLTRKQISKMVSEGEYVTDGKSIHKISPKRSVRRPASVRTKNHAKKRAPYNHTLPYAKETPHEKDMPFISVPTAKVRKQNKTIVMDDPATEVKPAAEPARAPASDVREPDTFDIR